MVERVYRELAHLRERFDRTIRHTRDFPEPRYGPGWEHGFDEREQRLVRVIPGDSPNVPPPPKPLRAPEPTHGRDYDCADDFWPSR